LAGKAPEADTSQALKPRKALANVYGRAATANVWTHSPWCWEVFTRASLADAAEASYRHQGNEGVPVLVQHDGPAVGLVKRWSYFDESGNLNVEMWLIDNQAGRMASHYVCNGVLSGLSLGVKATDTDWLHLSPGEWSASDNRLDVAEDRHVEYKRYR
jgi:hypothetical protein